MYVPTIPYRLSETHLIFLLGLRKLRNSDIKLHFINACLYKLVLHLGWISTSLAVRLKCLTQWHWWGSNQWPIDFKWSTLLLSHSTPLSLIMLNPEYIPCWTNIDNSRWVSFDIKFTRQGFEKAWWHREVSSPQQNFLSNVSCSFFIYYHILFFIHLILQ